MDSASKFLRATAIPDKTASTVARGMVESVFLRYGCPTTIVTDGGKEFVNQLNAALCDQLGIEQRTTSPYHPASNGQVERVHLTLGNSLRAISSPDQSDWDLVLPYLCFAINTATPRTTRVTPFMLMHGREPRTVLDALLATPPEHLTREVWWQRLVKAREVA